MNVKLNKKDCAIVLTNDFNLNLIIPKEKEFVEENVLFLISIALLYREGNDEFFKLIKNKIKDIEKIKLIRGN